MGKNIKISKKIREEKGSVALFVLLACLLILALVATVSVNQKNRASKIDNEFRKVKEIYEKDVGNEANIYEEKMRRIEQ